MIYFSKLYDCELSATEVVELLRPQAIGTFEKWHNTPGLPHEQLQQGIKGRCMFCPPILFGTRGTNNPTEKLEFVVQECGDQEVPMRVLRLDGWPVDTLEESPLTQR